jgi:hypothetical protein
MVTSQMALVLFFVEIKHDIRSVCDGGYATFRAMAGIRVEVSSSIFAAWFASIFETLFVSVLFGADEWLCVFPIHVQLYRVGPRFNSNYVADIVENVLSIEASHQGRKQIAITGKFTLLPEGYEMK